MPLRQQIGKTSSNSIVRVIGGLDEKAFDVSEIR